MHLLTAICAFFRILFNRQLAESVQRLLKGETPPEAPAQKKPAPAQPKPKPAPPKAPSRSDAISLLAALQREARFVDFLQEPLADYTDAQIGAAARDVHRDCGKVIERMFALAPVLDEEEGAAVEAPAGYDTSCYRLTGNVTGEPPFRGTMVHHGWKATRCEIPQWSGAETAALVLAPAEVELK